MFTGLFFGAPDGAGIKTERRDWRSRMVLLQELIPNPVGAASSRDTHGVWFMKRQRKEKGCFLILLFLDEKKQKSHT
jgi:hypothetical protein